jgi:hypothetical protein
MLGHDRLRRHQQEGVVDEPAHVVARLVLGPLERIGAQVEDSRQPQLRQRFGPDVQSLRPLLQERGLPLQVAQAGEVAVVGPIEELAPLVWTFAGEQIALVVAIEVHCTR